MKSSLLNMVVVLLCITAVTSAAVGLVYSVTEQPIAAAKAQKKVAALAQVLPEFDNAPVDEMQAVAMDGDTVRVYTARRGGEIVGYAVESFTNSGFSGLIRLMAGFDPQGNIVGISVLEQAETPGLGAKIADEVNPVKTSFIGRNPAELKMSVKKDGGDIDAITASTISSRAYVQAVNRAYGAFLKVSGGDMSTWDSSSGATASAKSSHDADSGTTDTASGATTVVGASDTSSGATVTGGSDASTGATSAACSENTSEDDSAMSVGTSDTSSGATVTGSNEASAGAVSATGAENAAEADTGSGATVKAADSASGATVQSDAAEINE